MNKISKLQPLPTFISLTSSGLLLFSLGFIIRFLILILSSGTNDIISWQEFASIIARFGLKYTYVNVRLFNHPPLMGYYSVLALKISQWLSLPFAYVFKFPMIMVDLVTALLLWKIFQKGHVAARSTQKVIVSFSLSFIAILISAYHGNTDNLLAFMILLSAYFIDNKKPLLAGLIFAGSLNVKLISLILLPLYLFSFPIRKNFLRFCSGLVLGLLPFVPILYCCSSSFYQNAILYNSGIENWGIDLFLIDAFSYIQLRQLSLHIAQFYIPNGRFIIIGLLILLGYRNYRTQKLNIYELTLLGYALFLILTPGFGIQYLVHLVAILFIVNRKWGVVYSSLSGLFAALIYYSFWNRSIPFHSQFYTIYPPPAPLFGFMVWVLLIFFVLQLLQKLTQKGTKPTSKQSRRGIKHILAS